LRLRPHKNPNSATSRRERRRALGRTVVGSTVKGRSEGQLHDRVHARLVRGPRLRQHEAVQAPVLQEALCEEGSYNCDAVCAKLGAVGRRVRSGAWDELVSQHCMHACCCE
jgi:hypothetical protein